MVKCDHCTANNVYQPALDCQICLDQNIDERVICDLWQRRLHGDNSTCHAFRPQLALVGRKPDTFFSGMASFKEKTSYFVDVVRQVMSGGCGSSSGCGGSCDAGWQPSSALNSYHIIWSVRNREPLFKATTRYLTFIHEALLSCSTLMNGHCILLWLAPDHVHLYLEIEPDDQVKDVVEDLQVLCHDAVCGYFPELANDSTLIWEKEFFVEDLL